MTKTTTTKHGAINYNILLYMFKDYRTLHTFQTEPGLAQSVDSYFEGHGF